MEGTKQVSRKESQEWLGAAKQGDFSLLTTLLASNQSLLHHQVSYCYAYHSALATLTRCFQLMPQHVYAEFRNWAQRIALVCSQRVPGVFAVAAQAGSRCQQPECRGQHPIACSRRQWSGKHCTIPVGSARHIK